MAEKGAKYPSVFTVDSYRTEPPPLPPRPGRRRQFSTTVVLLFLLVSLALCGMAVEAWLIYRLYNQQSTQHTAVAMPSAEKLIGTQVGPAHTKWSSLLEPPPRPLAHLTDGPDVESKNNVLSWSMIAQPLLYKVDYKDGSIFFQESGYYYIYSKVSFRADHSFSHSIELRMKLYLGNRSQSLLMSRHSLQSKQSTSFLAGIFHFYVGEAIFVKVSDSSHVAHQDPTENVFGVYMM